MEPFIIRSSRGHISHNTTGKVFRVQIFFSYYVHLFFSPRFYAHTPAIKSHLVVISSMTHAYVSSYSYIKKKYPTTHPHEQAAVQRRYYRSESMGLVVLCAKRKCIKERKSDLTDICHAMKETPIYAVAVSKSNVIVQLKGSRRRSGQYLRGFRRLQG